MCSVVLYGDSKMRVLQSQTTVPRDVMVSGSSKGLFTFMGQRIRRFLEHHQLPLKDVDMDHGRPFLTLGFSFSFAAYQAGMFLGELLRLVVFELYCDENLKFFRAHNQNASYIGSSISLWQR